MKIKELSPWHVPIGKLVRIGPNFDGGYIVHKKSIKLTKFIFSFGLGENWGFEKDFTKINKHVQVLAFDHTINKKFWLFKFCKDLFGFFIFKKLSFYKIKNIFLFIDYFFFFRKNHKHFQLEVSSRNNKKEINLKNIFKIKKLKKNQVLLKIDIEGSEYKILKDILIYEKYINTLIVEFHNVSSSTNRFDIIKFIRKLKKLKLIHIHGNNAYLINNKKYNMLELTFVNKKEIKVGRKFSVHQYPLKDLDYPNFKKKKDINLNY